MSDFSNNIFMDPSIEERQNVEVKIKGLRKYLNTIKALEQAQAASIENNSSSADGNTMTPQQYIELFKIAAAKHFELVQKANEKMGMKVEEQYKKQKEAAIAAGNTQFIEYEEKMIKAFNKKYANLEQAEVTARAPLSFQYEITDEAGPDTIPLEPYPIRFRNVIFKPDWMKIPKHSGKISKKVRKANKIAKELAKEAVELEKMIIEQGLYIVDGLVYSFIKTED